VIYFIHPLFLGGSMATIGLWLSRGNAGWVSAAIGFVIIIYLIITED
jgi:hypothetical protein